MLNRLTFGGLALTLVIAPAAFARDYVPGEVIVKLRNSATEDDGYQFVGKASSLRAMQLKTRINRAGVFHFTLPKGQTVEEAVGELSKDPSVQYAEPNYYLTVADSTGLQQKFNAEQVNYTAASSPSSNQATGSNIGAQTAWSSVSASSTKPIVAVIDTGMMTTHPVFVKTGAVYTNPGEIAGDGIDNDGNGFVDDVHGWNFVDNSANMYDDDGHGTHVAGIVLSVDQNIFAANSTLKPAKIQIMPLKFLNGNGVGTTSDAIRAIYYAANMGASVINNSWGGDGYSAALQDAVAYSYSKGALFVAAAGNAAANNDAGGMYPANYRVPNVISIAATTDYDYLASFSNFGASSVHLGSPGVYIMSTYNDGAFASMSGTSMATPFVSGTAAQMKVVSPNMLGYQLREILTSQFDSVAQLAGKVSTSGRLSTSDAVTYSKTAAVETTQPAYTASYLSDRGLASNVAGGSGCGMVRELGKDEPPSFGGAAGVVVGLLFAPLAVLAAMRLRSPKQRRKHERFQIKSDVRMTVGDQEMVGSISSISLGGVQVNTSALLQDGGLVTMHIASPDGSERLEVSGQVVWSAANEAYGVAFDHAPQSVLSRVADWTRSLQKAA